MLCPNDMNQTLESKTETKLKLLFLRLRFGQNWTKLGWVVIESREITLKETIAGHEWQIPNVSLFIVRCNLC